MPQPCGRERGATCEAQTLEFQAVVILKNRFGFKSEVRQLLDDIFDT